MLADALDEQIHQPRLGAGGCRLRSRAGPGLQRSWRTAGLETVPHQASDEIREPIDAGTLSPTARNDRARNDVDHVPIEPLHARLWRCPSMPVVGRTYKRRIRWTGRARLGEAQTRYLSTMTVMAAPTATPSRMGW